MHTVAQMFRARSLVSVEPFETALVAARRMCEHDVGAIVVLDGEQLVGIFSERDLMKRVVAAGRSPADTPVSAVMTREVVTATVRERVDECEATMKRVGCRHLPVVADGRVIGMISMRDLLNDELAEERQDARELRAYLHQAPLEG